MNDLMQLIISLGIGAVIIIVQQLLSRGENWIWGSILPIVSLLFTIVVFYFEKIQFNLRNLMPFIILIVIQVSIWEESRKKVKEKQKLELNKMKSRDL